MLAKMMWRIQDRLALMAARRAYKRADRATMKASGRDDVPAGMWEALDDVRRAYGFRLIDAEVAYLQGVKVQA